MYLLILETELLIGCRYLKNFDMESIADRMKKIMYHHNYSTSETADSIGVSESELSEILNKNLGIPVDIFDRFCDTFFVNPEWLRFGDSIMPTGEKYISVSIEQVKIAELVKTTYENNMMLKEILKYIHKVDDDEYVTKKQLHDFINNVVADLFADMLLQPKGRGHIDKEFINDVITKMK